MPTWINFQVEPLSNEIHVVRINISKNLHRISDQKNLLEDSEKQKLSRIIKQEDKNIFLCSQVMKRIVCGHYLNIPPNEISFDFTKNKKPFISGQADFHFNISHSGNWMTMMFSKDPCGIDVEKIQPDLDFDGVMQSAFHPDEIRYVQQSSDLTKAFFRIWTIKESFLKATGVGLIDNLIDLNMMNPPTKGSPNPGLIQSFMVEGNYWCSICYQAQNPKLRFFEF